MHWLINRMSRHRTLAVLGICALAGGIGVRGAVSRVLPRLMPTVRGVDAPEKLVVVLGSSLDSRRLGTVSYLEFQTVGAQTAKFLSLAAVTTVDLEIAGGRQQELLNVEAVSGNYFSTVGIRPMVGRFFNQDDGTRASPRDRPEFRRLAAPVQLRPASCRLDAGNWRRAAPRRRRGAAGIPRLPSSECAGVGPPFVRSSRGRTLAQPAVASLPGAHRTTAAGSFDCGGPGALTAARRGPAASSGVHATERRSLTCVAHSGERHVSTSDDSSLGGNRLRRSARRSSPGCSSGNLGSRCARAGCGGAPITRPVCWSPWPLPIQPAQPLCPATDLRVARPLAAATCPPQ